MCVLHLQAYLCIPSKVNHKIKHFIKKNKIIVRIKIIIITKDMMSYYARKI